MCDSRPLLETLGPSVCFSHGQAASFGLTAREWGGGLSLWDLGAIPRGRGGASLGGKADSKEEALPHPSTPRLEPKVQVPQAQSPWLFLIGNWILYHGFYSIFI